MRVFGLVGFAQPSIPFGYIFSSGYTVMMLSIPEGWSLDTGRDNRESMNNFLIVTAHVEPSHGRYSYYQQISADI